ncbi:MAG: cellulase family glycosylhydrolase [Micromonosporaceae bacterium]|nr:cellulase family glycosylhydrolase [Micromonosporaceae bacterium]
MRNLRAALITAATVLLVTGTAVVAGVGTTWARPDSPEGGDAGYVTRVGSELLLHGEPFRFAGTNNYYLEYSSPLMVNDVFDRAAAAGFTVLRTWGWLDIGNQDGSNSVAGKKNGVYFQYWDGTAPAYNDGVDGLSKLDYVIAQAAHDGIKLVIPFTNNWSDFGGIDQYVRWAGGTHHDDFYTDPRIQGWYQAWIAHVLNHVNTITGLAYKDDPTIMTWELANEPRCKGSGLYPPSPTCSTGTLVSWADTMSRYIKTIDPHHLVSVGDEGFYATDPGGSDWTTSGGEGVDTLAFTALPAVDVMSFHLYPDSWGKTADWGTDWIRSHVQDARRLHKAVMLGEFGLLDKATRNPVYRTWTDALISGHGNGLLYWILSGRQDDGTLYPDYDGFTVYCPSPVCQTISNAEVRLATGRPVFPPVADDDSATTGFDTPATVAATANDIAYLTTIQPQTVDLDPATAGRQTAVTVPAGQFTVDSTGTVTFTPVAGFHGRTTATYTVQDRTGRVSNVATIAVTVKANPGAPIQFASFEDATLDGWAPGSWQTDAGTLSQQTDFHTDGAAGLHVSATGGGWFGANLATPVDISAKSALKVDLRTGPAAGTSIDIAIQNSADFTWCQGNFSFVPQGSTTTFVADLANGFSCDATTLTDIRAIWVYLSPGEFDLDNVRAE